MQDLSAVFFYSIQMMVFPDLYCLINFYEHGRIFGTNMQTVSTSGWYTEYRINLRRAGVHQKPATSFTRYKMYKKWTTSTQS